MGHFHSSNLDRLLLNCMHSQNSVSINDLVDLAQKKKQVVHASEGTYDEKYLIQQGFETLLFIHHDEHHIEPILNSRKEKRAFNRWKNGTIWDYDVIGNDGESVGDLAIVDAIKFKFCDGIKSSYRKLVIDEVDL